MLTLDEAAARLFDAATGRAFDQALRRWSSAAPAGEPVSLVEAATWLQRRSGHPVRQPVGVIGPRAASPAQLTAAEAIGAALGAIGLTIVCGGREGVMEAVCRGAAGAGGLTIGLLPDPDIAGANPYVTVPLATGIGEARNALVARAAFCLVVVGDSFGTLSEVALGLQFGRPVIGLPGAPQVTGMRAAPTPAAAIDMVARLALALE